MSIFKSFFQPKQPQHQNQTTSTNTQQKFNRSLVLYTSTHKVSDLKTCLNIFFTVPSDKIQGIPQLAGFTKAVTSFFVQSLSPLSVQKLDWLTSQTSPQSISGEEVFKCLMTIAQFGSVDNLAIFTTSTFLSKLAEVYSFLLDLHEEQYLFVLYSIMSLIILSVTQPPRQTLPHHLMVIRFDRADFQISLLPLFQTISRAHMNENFLSIVSHEQSIPLTIRSLHNSNPSPDMLRLVEAYISFIRSSANISDSIINRLVKEGFYDELLRIILQADNEQVDGVDGVLEVLSPLIYYGTFCPKISIDQPYNSLKRIQANRCPFGIIRNIEIPTLLQNYFLQTTRIQGKIHALKIIEKMYWENPLNYPILGTIQYSQRFYIIFNNTQQQLRDILLSLLIYLSRCQRYVPYDEIKMLATHLTTTNISQTPALISSFDYLVTQLLYDNKAYQTIFKETGLTINAITVFIYYATNSNTDQHISILPTTIRILTNIITQSFANFSLLHITKFLIAVIEFYDAMQTEDLLRRLVEPIESDPSPVTLLKCVSTMLHRSATVKDSFKRIDGFKLYNRFYIIWGWSIAEVPAKGIDDEKYAIIEWCVLSMIYAMKGSKENRKYFDEKFSDGTMLKFIENSPFLDGEYSKKYAERLCCLLIAVIFEIPDIDRVKSLGVFATPVGGIPIYHTFVIHSLLKLVKVSLQPSLQASVLNFLSITAQEDTNVRKMAQQQITTTLISEFSEHISNKTPLHKSVLGLLEELIAYDITPSDSSILLKSLKQQPFNKGLLQTLLNATIKSDRNGSLSFNTYPIGYACVTVPMDVPFPTPQWSFISWVSVPSRKVDLYLFQITHAVNGKEQALLSVILSTNGLRVVYNSKVIFEGIKMNRKWNHIGLVYRDKRLQLFVNGLQKQSIKLITITPTVYKCIIGHAKENKVIPNMTFNIGPLKFLDCALTEQQIKEIYLLGEMYQGTFQSTAYQHYEVLSNYDANDIDVIKSYTDVLNFSFKTFTLSINESSILVNTDRILSSFALNPCTAFGTVNFASSNNLTDGIYNIGGVALLLALVLKSDTPKKFTSALQLLLHSLRKSEGLTREFNDCNGVDLLNLFVYHQAKLITAETLSTILLLSAVIANPSVFDVLVLDFSIYHRCKDPQTAFLFILQSFVSLIYNNNYAIENIKILRSLKFLPRLIDLFQDNNLSDGVIQIIVNLLQYFLLHECTSNDLKLIVRLLMQFTTISDDKSTTSLILKKTELRCNLLMKLIMFLTINLKDKMVLSTVFTPSIAFHILSSQSTPLSVIISCLRLCSALTIVPSQTKHTFSQLFLKEKGSLYINYQLERCVESLEVIYTIFGLIKHIPTPDVVTSNFSQYKKTAIGSGSVQSPEHILSLIKLHHLQVRHYQTLSYKPDEEKQFELIQFTSQALHDMMQSPEISNVILNDGLYDYISVLVDRNGYFHENHPLESIFQSHLTSLSQCMMTHLLLTPNKTTPAHELLYENTSFLREDELNIFLTSTLQTITNLLFTQLTSQHPIDRLSSLLSTFLHGRIDFYLLNITTTTTLFSIFNDTIRLLKLTLALTSKQKSVHSLYEVVDRLLLLIFDRANPTDLANTLNLLTTTMDIVFSEVNQTDNFAPTLLHFVVRSLYTHSSQQKVMQHYQEILESLNYQNDLNFFINNKDEILHMDVDCLLKSAKQWMTDEGVRLATILSPLDARRGDKQRSTELTDATRVDTIRRSQQRFQQTRQRVSQLFRRLNFTRTENFRTQRAESQGAWTTTAESLFLKGGIWYEKTIEKWRLDITEGPCRMRKRLVLDNDFFDRYKTTFNGDYVDVELKMIIQTIILLEPTQNFIPQNEITKTRPRANTATNSSNNAAEDDLYKMMQTTFDDDEKLHFIKNNDVVKGVFNCGVVKGMEQKQSVLIVCVQALYIVEGLQREHKSFVIATETSTVHTERIAAEDVSTISPRRFMLRNIAIEIFAASGRTSLLVFDREYDAALKALGPFRQKQDDILALKIFASTDPVTQKWQDGKMSNFHYLMYLNAKSGRTFNDVTQYPVMPWVLADYTSATIDLDDPRIYRDLSKPIGALTPERAEATLERYENVKDVPEMAFHYGSHYTSVGVTLYFLIRCEPFSALAQQLQGGRFDIAERLFSSIEDLWTILTSPNVKQVMELTPEFFYFPDFLRNFNSFHFQPKESSGSPVDNVVLPRWARGSYRRFVRCNMRALESKTVSDHLHEWIDLIFGYKQTGEQAEKALNLFHPSSYEGGVDIEKVQDVKMKKAFEDMIINFGQTPIQLFTQPHPKRNVSENVFNHGVLLSDNWNVIASKQTNGVVKAITVNQQDFNSVNAVIVRNGKSVVCRGDGSVKIVCGGKVGGVIENAHPPGEIVCDLVGDVLVTGGGEATVNVFNISNGIEFVTTADEKGLIVLWDLYTLKVIRTFKHGDHVLFVSIQNETGEIVSVSKSLLKHWSINAELIQQASFKQHPTAVCLANIPEWVEGHVLITGHQDGSICCWKLDEEQCLGSGDCSTHQHQPCLIKFCLLYECAVSSFLLTDDNTTLFIGYSDGLIQKIN
ncbi:Beige/BEACH domain containing protein [Entamoeba marina]